MKFHVDAFFPAGFSLLELAFLISIQGSSRGLHPNVSGMSSSETHLAEPFGSRRGITRRTRESVDDESLASDGCGLSRLAEDFSSLLINDNESAPSLQQGLRTMAKLGVRCETPPAKLLSFAKDLTLVPPVTVVFSNAYEWPLGCTSSVGSIAC